MKFPNLQNIANLAAALFLTLTTPDHLVADAYHAAGRAMDFNHDVSSLRAQDQEKQVEEEIEEQRLVFEDGYESDTSYNLRKAVLKHEKSLAIKQAKGQSISLLEQYELDSLIDAYEERATGSAEVRAWKKTHQWVKDHPKRAAALGASGVLMTASGVMTSTGVGIIPAATTSALGSALLDYGLTDESVPTTEKAINMGKAATLGAVPYLKFSHMLKASGGIALYGYAADDSMMKWGGGLTFAGSVLVKGVQTLVKGACVVPSSSVSKNVEALGLEVPRVKTQLPKGLTSDKLLKGEYRKVKGHHVHAKKAFEGHVNYDPKTGFSISHEYMKSLEIDHDLVTQSQRKLFRELFESGRPNTIFEHNRIAVESLIEGGCQSRELARSIVAESLESLRFSKVREPMNIPWHNKK